MCQSACNAFLSSCSSFVDSLSASIQSVVRSSLPSCADLPTTGCIDLSVYYASLNDTHFALRNVSCFVSTTPHPDLTLVCISYTKGPGSGSSGSGPAPSACPAPLLPNPFEANDTYPHNCFGACCIACPLTPSFYPVGWIDQVNTMSAVLMVVSWVVCVFTVASYTYLPNKQHYPADIIRNIAIALLVFYSSNFFSFGPYGRFAWQYESFETFYASTNECDDIKKMRGLPEQPHRPLPPRLHSKLARSRTRRLCRVRHPLCRCVVRPARAVDLHGTANAQCWDFLSIGFLTLSLGQSVVFMSTRLGEYPKTYNVVVWSICWIPIIIGLACNQFGYLGMGTVVRLFLPGLVLIGT